MIRSLFTESGKIRKPDRYCHTCELDLYGWTREQIQTHMVDAHGFKRDGAQVYLHRVCRMCSKTGIYRVGTFAYCSAHRQEAIRHRATWCENLTLRAIDQQETTNRIERKMRTKDKMRSVQWGK